MVLLLIFLIAIPSLFAMVALLKFTKAKPISFHDKSNKKPTSTLRCAPSKTNAASKASPATASYVPFNEASFAGAVVVDCTHPDAPTFTHHKSARNPDGLEPADTSTGLVLNALASGSAFPGWLDRPAVSVNHFDGDALFSVWAFIHRTEAQKYADLLRCAATLHDFREMPNPFSGSSGGGDFSSKGEEDASAALARQALALCCWINTVECDQFSPPFEESDADEKFAYFLIELENFLKNPDSFKNIWIREYNQVLEDIKLIQEHGHVEKYPEIGVAIVKCPRPVHYYALFSQTLGCDVVLSEYLDADTNNSGEIRNTNSNGGGGGGWRYEVEEKYTQFVNVWSRPVTPRLDMTPLAALLNEVDKERKAGCDWASPRLVDSGPLLRLDSQGQKLLKSQRYGHPTARPMHSSGLSPEKFEEIVLSFFRFGLNGVESKRGGFSWDELHQLNANKIDWNAWKKQIKAALQAS